MALRSLALKITAEPKPCEGDGEKCEGCGDLRFLSGVDIYVYAGKHLAGIIILCQSCGDRI